MPNRGILGSAITSHDYSEQPLVTQLTWIGVWWVAKKQGFIPWTKGKHCLTSPGQKSSTLLQPTDLFSPVPRGEKELWQGPPTKCCLSLEVPGTNSNAESGKGGHCLQLQPYTVPWLQITPSDRVQPLPATVAQQMEWLLSLACRIEKWIFCFRGKTVCRWTEDHLQITEIKSIA